jgi:uncharacterized protein YqjF (DUF2071 family)
MSSLTADHRVIVPVVTSDWLTAAFVHWPCPAKVIQARLPPGLSVDAYEGSA